MKAARLTILLSLLFLLQQVRGQEPIFTVFSPGQKTGGSSLQSIMQDSRGFIWLGTSSGIYRFDGISYSPVPADDTLTGASVTAMFQGNEGTIWVGTEKGLLGTINKHRLELYDAEEGHPASPITGIVQDLQGNTWFSTYGEGIYCLSSGRIYNFSKTDGLGDDFTYTIAPDNKGNVWTGSDRGISVCSLRDGKKSISTITTADGLPDNIVREIHPDGEQMWICMQDGGICMMNAVTHAVVFPPPLKQWSYGTVNDLVVAGNRLWAGTEDHGIISLGFGAGGEVQVFRNPGGSEHLKIARILADREGNIWFLAGSTLIRSPGSRIEILAPSKDRNFSNIHSILCDRDHNIWFSNDDGLFRFRPGSSTTF